MKLDKWLCQFKDKLDREEVNHLEVNASNISMQFENPITKVIELHQWEFKAKNTKEVQYEKQIS